MDIARISDRPDLFETAGWQDLASRSIRPEYARPLRRAPNQADSYGRLAAAMREIEEDRRLNGRRRGA